MYCVGTLPLEAVLELLYVFDTVCIYILHRNSSGLKIKDVT